MKDEDCQNRESSDVDFSGLFTFNRWNTERKISQCSLQTLKCEVNVLLDEIQLYRKSGDC